MPIQGHLCNNSWVPFQPPFQVDLCADPGTLQLPEKGKEEAFLMMEVYGHWCYQIAVGQLLQSLYPSMVSAGVSVEAHI